MPLWVPRLYANTNKSSIRWRTQSSLLAHLTRRLSRANTAEAAHAIAIARKILNWNLKPNAFSSLLSTSTQKLEDDKGLRNNSVISQMRKLSVHQRNSVPAKCPLTNSLKQLRHQIMVHQKSSSSMSSSCHRVVSVRAYPWNPSSRPSARPRPRHSELKRCLISARHKRASSHHRRRSSHPSRNSTWLRITEAKKSRQSSKRLSR